MANKIPVAWIANDGRMLRVFPSLAEASARSGVSDTSIRERMKKPDTNFREPTLKDLKENYLFEVEIGDVNTELVFLMKVMMD